jgi:alkylhydroperoxidase family enzyme
MSESDVAALRAQGLDDRAIHDAAQVTAYFNYINRVADALHVDLEPEMPPDPRE